MDDDETRVEGSPLSGNQDYSFLPPIHYKVPFFQYSQDTTQGRSMSDTTTMQPPAQQVVERRKRARRAPGGGGGGGARNEVTADGGIGVAARSGNSGGGRASAAALVDPLALSSSNTSGQTTPTAHPPPTTTTTTTTGKQSIFDPPSSASASASASARREPTTTTNVLKPNGRSVFDIPAPLLSSTNTNTNTNTNTSSSNRNIGNVGKSPGRAASSSRGATDRGTPGAAAAAAGDGKGKRTRKVPVRPVAAAGLGTGEGMGMGMGMGEVVGEVAGGGGVGAGGSGGAGAAGGSWYRSATLQDILDELSSRFILHLPEEELASPERVCFQIEQAHWFYEDFIREESPTLPTYRLRDFCKVFIAHCPLLSSQWGSDAASERAFERFLMYKKRVPVCGAIMLNADWSKCVLVKGWKAGSSWGFPKGKMNNDEPKHLCAIREVEEETGYNCASLLNEHDYIQITMNDQEITLFIVTGVPEETAFSPQTRKEISAIEWFRLGELPTWSRKRMDQRPAKFFLIAPFVVPLKTWMRQMVDAAAGSGSGTEGTDDADQVVHVDPEHHEHHQLDQSTISPSVQPTAAITPAITNQEITATTNGQPSVLDDLFSKFTLASEKNEVKHGAAQRQRTEEDRADPAMQNLLGRLMVHSGPAASVGDKDSQGHVLGESAVGMVPGHSMARDSDAGKQEKQQALMNKLMSSLGGTSTKAPPSEYLADNHPHGTIPQHLQQSGPLPSTPSRQGVAPAGTHGFDQSPRLHHPYSTINGAGLPVLTHNPALAGLTGHTHPGLTQPHFHGPLPPPPSQHYQHMGESPLPAPGALSHVTSNLLNILTPPRPTGATQFPHPSMPNGNMGRPLHSYGGNAMPDPTQNFGPHHPEMPSQHMGQAQHHLFGLLASPQPNMAQTQNLPPAPRMTGGQYMSHGPLPGPIQLPLHSGQPELNRILPYQMLPAHHAHAIETNNGYPMHGGHLPPPQFQQLHPAQMFSPPHQPASVVQAHPLLSLLNPRPNIQGIGSPPTTSAKTADGLLAMLVGNGRHEGGNG